MGLDQNCNPQGKLDFSKAYTGTSPQRWILLPILSSGGEESEGRNVDVLFLPLTWSCPNFRAMLLK